MRKYIGGTRPLYIAVPPQRLSEQEINEELINMCIGLLESTEHVRNRTERVLHNGAIGVIPENVRRREMIYSANNILDIIDEDTYRRYGGHPDKVELLRRFRPIVNDYVRILSISENAISLEESPTIIGEYIRRIRNNEDPVQHVQPVQRTRTIPRETVERLYRSAEEEYNRLYPLRRRARRSRRTHEKTIRNSINENGNG